MAVVAAQEHRIQNYDAYFFEQMGACRRVYTINSV
jgi:hypothetical protein